MSTTIHRMGHPSIPGALILWTDWIEQEECGTVAGNVHPYELDSSELTWRQIRDGTGASPCCGEILTVSPPIYEVVDAENAVDAAEERLIAAYDAAVAEAKVETRDCLARRLRDYLTSSDRDDDELSSAEGASVSGIYAPMDDEGVVAWTPIVPGDDSNAEGMWVTERDLGDDVEVSA